MVIPGYDAGNVAEFTHESAGARVAVVAGVVPETFGLERSDRDPPIDALSTPVHLRGVDGLKAIEAVRISLAYDPSGLPPGASPTDVAVAVETSVASETQRADGEAVDEKGWEPLESTVDLAETTVETVLNDRPPGSTVVAGYDDSDASTGGTIG